MHATQFPTATTTTVPFPTASPAYKNGVYFGLTITFTILYSLIFLGVYIQLILILYYRHKRFSYQTGFLFLCLIWSCLRIILFSFYFHNADDANRLEFCLYFLFYCFPVVIQFCILCLLVLFFGQVYFKAATRINYKRNSRILQVILIISILIFLAASVVGSYIPRELCILKQVFKNCDKWIYEITVIRVLVTDMLFVILGFLLSVFLFNLAKLPTASMLMEQQGSSICQALTVTISMSILFISRTVYNFLAITLVRVNLPDFGFDWINVSDQADLVNLTETKKYATFIVVLLIWEIVPTFVVLILFRIKRNEIINYQTNTNIITRIIGKSQFISNSNTSINNCDEDENGDGVGPSETTNLLTRERDRSNSISVLENSDDSSSSIMTYHSINYDRNPTQIQTQSPIMNFVNHNYNFIE